LAEDDELIRSYWFRPQKILDSYYTTDNIERQVVFKNFNKYFENFKTNRSVIPSEILIKIKSQVDEIGLHFILMCWKIIISFIGGSK